MFAAIDVDEVIFNPATDDADESGQIADMSSERPAVSSTRQLNGRAIKHGPTRKVH